MEHINDIFKKKIEVLVAKKKVYENAIKLGFDLKTIIRFDTIMVKEEELKIIKFFETYDPVITPKTVDLIENSKNGINDDFKNLITEKINDDHSFGIYGNFKIIICNKSGYVNGTQLLFEAFKFENTFRLKKKRTVLTSYKIDHWLDLRSTKDLLFIIGEDEDLKENELTFDITGRQKKGEEILQGKYVHPLLVNSLAIWMSPCYAVKINKLINELNIAAQKDKIMKIKRSKKVKKNMLIEMREMYNSICKENRIIEHKTKIVVEKLENVTNNLCKAVGLIDEVKYDALYVYKLQVSADTPMYYTCYRILIVNAKKTFKKHDDFYFSDRIYFRPSVNATKAWIKYKDENNNVNIKTKGSCYNDFDLLGNYGEENLKIDFNRLFEEFDNVKF